MTLEKTKLLFQPFNTTYCTSKAWTIYAFIVVFFNNHWFQPLTGVVFSLLILIQSSLMALININNNLIHERSLREFLNNPTFSNSSLCSDIRVYFDLMLSSSFKQVMQLNWIWALLASLRSKSLFSDNSCQWGFRAQQRVNIYSVFWIFFALNLLGGSNNY